MLTSGAKYGTDVFSGFCLLQDTGQFCQVLHCLFACLLTVKRDHMKTQRFRCLRIVRPVIQEQAFFRLKVIAVQQYPEKLLIRLSEMFLPRDGFPVQQRIEISPADVMHPQCFRIVGKQIDPVALFLEGFYQIRHIMKHYTPAVCIVKEPLQRLPVIRKTGQTCAANLFISDQIIVIADPQPSLRIRNTFSEQQTGSDYNKTFGDGKGQAIVVYAAEANHASMEANLDHMLPMLAEECGIFRQKMETEPTELAGHEASVLLSWNYSVKGADAAACGIAIKDEDSVLYIIETSDNKKSDALKEDVIEVAKTVSYNGTYHRTKK